MNEQLLPSQLRYMRHIEWRLKTIQECLQDRDKSKRLGDYYAHHPVEFIDDWIDTFDPRNSSKGMLTRMPFRLFVKQRELISFFYDCVMGEANGLVEKSRDMGATWAAIAFSVWVWLFRPGSSVGFGSRKAQYVDRIGDLDSIFEKIRRVVDGLPPMFKPDKYDGSYMKMINHDNGCSITGESGDEIGRGGRKLVYFKDESAHYEHPEAIEAALSENTRVQIDISSVNGVGNVFHRRRESGIDWSPGIAMERNRTYVFVLDWRDHPDKTQEWYLERQRKFEQDGLLHVFRQEVDRDYSASQVGAIIRREWITSAIDAHLRFPDMLLGTYVAGLDVADGGSDTNAFVRRKGVVLEHVAEWGERDTGHTARRAVAELRGFIPVQVMYDCVGIGSGVKSEINRLVDDGLMPQGVRFVPWDAGAQAEGPDDPVIKGDANSPLNKDHYMNLKAQGWWELRSRLEKTHRAVTENATYPPDQLISISSEMTLLRKLEKELLQPTSSLSSTMRVIVDKTPEGTRSPNLADAVMMCFHPVNKLAFDTTYSWL